MGICGGEGEIVIFGKKMGNLELSPKNENCHILSFLDVQLHARNQKKYIAQFWHTREEIDRFLPKVLGLPGNQKARNF